MKGGGAKFWLLLIGALVLVVLVVGGSGEEGPPLDPRSVSPDGARGLVETLERLGARVDIDDAVPDPDATTALLLQDRLTFADESALENWVRQGGVLVVADNQSSLAAERSLGSGPGGARVIDRGRCSIAALADVQTLRVRNSARLRASEGDSCFREGDGAFVVAQRLGQGTVVTVADPAIFANTLLDEEDAAVLAVSLLAPTGERSHVSFIRPSVVDFGDEGLGDLVAPRVVNAILQLLAAFLIYALYRSRRLGAVVPEPDPVRIEGSEIVLKAGLLSERAKDPASAAALLRSDAVGRARRALSIPASQNDRGVSNLIAARTGLSADEITRTLKDPVASEADLVRVANELAAIDDLLYQRVAASAATPPLTSSPSGNESESS